MNDSRPRPYQQWMRAAFLVLAITLACAVDAASATFFSGYAGSLPADPRDKARTYFDMPAVRSLIAMAEDGPVEAATVERVLAGSEATADDLIRVGLFRRDGGRYWLNFAYFTAEDMRTIYTLVDRLAPSLAAAYVRQRGELDRILARYPVRSVPRADLAFVLIAGISLNWDGLKVTQAMGYRKPILVTGDGFRYSFWASEAIDGRSYREMYWGSSTFPAEELAWSFSSFGDADSDPRMNFPDLMALPADEILEPVRVAARSIGFRDDEIMGRRFENVLGDEILDPVSTILFELRKGPAGVADLSRAIGGDAKPLLALLTEIEYVRRDGGLYRLRVPVLDESDRAMVDEALRWNRGILSVWLASHHSEMRRELTGLTAMRAGLPFEALFTQIWHELFGAVTRELAQRRVIASAYTPGRRYKGSLSMLWRRSLYRLTPG